MPFHFTFKIFQNMPYTAPNLLEFDLFREKQRHRLLVRTIDRAGIQPAAPDRLNTVPQSGKGFKIRLFKGKLAIIGE